MALGFFASTITRATSLAALAGVVALGMLWVPPAAAQIAPSTSALPSFEVASIKLSAIYAGVEGNRQSTIEYSPASLRMRNVSVLECVQWAYGLQFFQISGLNAFGERYDILATAGHEVPVSGLRLMLQRLLAERFNLKIRTETKVIAVYELRVVKDGPKLPAPLPDSEAPATHASKTLPEREGDDIVFPRASMAGFAAALNYLHGIDRPVLDRTGIPGTYDITLKSAMRVIGLDGSGTFGLLERQLGLKLEPAKGSVETLVVEHVAKPSAN